MYSINPETKAITLPQGDTLALTVSLTTNGEPATLPEGTVAVFGVCHASRYTRVFSKAFDVQDGQVHVHLSNADTRNIPVSDNYAWDLRVVTDPEYDEEGNVRCDDESDNVVSLFAGANAMPRFQVKGVATVV